MIPRPLVVLPLVFLSIVAPLGAASAQPNPSAATQVAPCPPNAALAYWRAWNTRVPAAWDNEYLRDEFKTFSPTWQPSAQAVGMLEAAQPDIAALAAAVKIERCDWGIPFEQEGIESLLVHLPKMRTTSRVLMADCRRLAAKGDMSGAIERLKTMLMMTRHLREDRVVNSVLTAQSIAVDMAMREMRLLAEGGKLDDAGRASLLEALNQFAGPDPWGMREALRNEPILMAISVKRACRGPEAAVIFVQKFAPRVKAEDRAQSGIDQLDEAGIHAAADRARVVYEDAMVTWDLPDPVKQMREVDAQRKNGDFGAVAALAGSTLGDMRLFVARVENAVKETIRVVSGQPATAPEGSSAVPGK